jgi:YaiO family outer membrane protein
VRLNYGLIYGYDTGIGVQHGFQYEIEAYPWISRNSYAFLNAGYSNAFSVFPKWQFQADIFQKIPNTGFEVSVGGAYLDVIDVVDTPDNAPPQNIWIFTPYIGYYYKELWWFSYRPYFTFEDYNCYVSHTFTIRRFFGNEDTYASIDFITGPSPYEDNFYISTVPVNQVLAGIDFQTRLPHNWLIYPSFMAGREEWFPGLWRNVYYSQIIITKRF